MQLTQVRQFLRSRLRTPQPASRPSEELPASEPATDAVVDDRNARYDRETIEVIKRVIGPGDAAVDVGANVGSILESIVDQSPEGRHQAFEPLPTFAEALRDKFPTVTVHQCALAAERGEATFHHVVTNPSYSGLKERQYGREDEEVQLITVAMERLDDVLPDDLVVRFVKIDVEGGELGVLQGAAGLLARDRPVIVFEHGLGAADYYGTRPEQLLEVFDACDYDVTLMENWLRGGPDLSPEAFVDEFQTCRNYYFLAHPHTAVSA